MQRPKVATLTDVARMAGVSVTTASKAINGQNRISEQTRQRVLDVARQLSFTPNPLARSLLSGRSGTVALIIFDSLAQRFAMPTMLGAEAALTDIDLSMVTADARRDPKRFRELAELFSRRKVDGLIVLGDNNAASPVLPRSIALPAVYLYGDPETAGTIAHVPDDFGGGALLADHVLALGRRRIVHLTGPRDTRAVRERVAGIQQRMSAAGVELVRPVTFGEWSQRWGAAAAGELLASGTRFDAVICGSDQIAAGVVAFLTAAGRRVPEDVIVTGYDNWPVFALESDPPLTSVDMRLEDLGAVAVRDLFAIIDGTPVEAGVRTHPCELVVRQSSKA